MLQWPSVETLSCHGRQLIYEERWGNIKVSLQRFKGTTKINCHAVHLARNVSNRISNDFLMRPRISIRGFVKEIPHLVIPS